MANKYLPVHARMAKCLKVGMTVVHNGGGKRQGLVGKIKSVQQGEDKKFILVHFPNSNLEFSQHYTKQWFLENFYISIDDVHKMGGYFNGKPFIEKYRPYMKGQGAMLLKKRNTHQELKAIVDAKASGFTSVIADKSDPLDEVGEYIVVGEEGHPIHKTQRLAEIAAGVLVKKYSRKFVVAKCVAVAEPVTEVNIKRK